MYRTDAGCRASATVMTDESDPSGLKVYCIPLTVLSWSRPLATERYSVLPGCGR